MKKSVSVARAMKEKNRVALRLRIAEYRMKQNNSQCTRIPRTFDVQQAYNDTQVLRERLIETKAAIAKASNPITEKLIQLNEIKAEISFLKDVSTKEGDFPRETYRSTDATFDTFTAIFTETQISEKVDQLQCQAEVLQDELDEFNAKTYVTIEVDW